MTSSGLQNHPLVRGFGFLFSFVVCLLVAGLVALLAWPVTYFVACYAHFIWHAAQLGWAAW